MRNIVMFVHCSSSSESSYGARFAPLWAFTLAAYLPEGFEARLLDCEFDDPARCEGAHVFAFSGINHDLERLLEVRALLAQQHPGAIFVLGGPITWSFEQQGRLGELAAFDHLFLLDAEETLPAFLSASARGEAAGQPRVLRGTGFDLSRARPIDFGLYRSVPAGRYFGAAIEVSRGCPFLCEFCDVRVIPGNDRANDKPPALIVREMRHYLELGISQFVFVCDNFIGDLAWARSCATAVAELRESAPNDFTIFTWLTLNIAKHPALMSELRRAGFSSLFIGIETVNQDALLETAKVQNRGDIQAAVARIHEHGFIVVPGLIFGFDSDTLDAFDSTLAFIEHTGLIGGDPSFLTALPGTPLFERMKRTARLVESSGPSARRKIETNVRYLQDQRALSSGFMRFVRELNRPSFQLRRLRRHLELVTRERVEFVSPRPRATLRSYLKAQSSTPAGRRTLLARFGFVARRPSTWLAIASAAWLCWRASRCRPGLFEHLLFWLFSWANLGLKYATLSERDFALHDVPRDYDVNRVASDARSKLTQLRTKAATQARHTSNALQRLSTGATREI